MKDDVIIRSGEIASEIFFIKSGKVGIWETNEKIKLAVMKEGTFFGEIGLLLSEKRTATVKAENICHFEVLSKQDFNSFIGDFPKELEYLKRVAIQRMGTVSETIGDTFEDNYIRGNSGFSEQLDSFVKEKNEIALQDREHFSDKVKNKFLKSFFNFLGVFALLKDVGTNDSLFLVKPFSK